MWSVGISVSPCADAAKIGYDHRQINRIVIRVAQYFLNRNMRVIFGHDWREDGVMRAVADFANIVAAGAEKSYEQSSHSPQSRVMNARMLNVVPTAKGSFSRAALDARLESGGALEVISVEVALESLSVEMQELLSPVVSPVITRDAELTTLRYCITALLDPGCRICMGGKTSGFEGREPGVIEEAKLALEYDKPLYLMGGFGGATRMLERETEDSYWRSDNGLDRDAKRELFETTDIEHALRLISVGIENVQTEMKDFHTSH